MAITPNINQRYHVADGSSVFNTVKNINSFFEDFAKLDNTNYLANAKFTILEAGKPKDWTVFNIPGSGTLNVSNRTVSFSIPAGGYIQQNIAADLQPNRTYTAALYAYCTSSNSLKFTVMGVSGAQVVNINDILEVNSASITAAAATAIEKNLIHFKSHATAIAGDINVRIQNISASTKTVVLHYSMVYQGLVEVASLPDYNLLTEYLEYIEFNYSTGLWNLKNLEADKVNINNDIEVMDNNFGLVMSDRTTGTRYRIYINNGALYMTPVTEDI